MLLFCWLWNYYSQQCVFGHNKAPRLLLLRGSRLRAPCNLYYLFFPRPASLFCGTQGMCAPLRAEWLTVEMSFERDLAARGPLHKRWMDRPTHPHLHAAWNETAAAFLFWNYGHNLTLQKRSHHIFPIVIGQCQQGVCPLLRAKYCSRCKRESFENYYTPWCISVGNIIITLLRIVWAWPGVEKTSSSGVSFSNKKMVYCLLSYCWLLGVKYLAWILRGHVVKMSLDLLNGSYLVGDKSFSDHFQQKRTTVETRDLWRERPHPPLLLEPFIHL